MVTPQNFIFVLRGICLIEIFVQGPGSVFLAGSPRRGCGGGLARVRC